MLTADGIGPKLAGEEMAEEIAVAAGVGEEGPAGSLVALPTNWWRILAPGGARVAAPGRRVLGDHRNELAAMGCLRPKL